MTTFSPATNIWSLNYDPFGGICWQNRATQELYFIPPGLPPTLPPRSLANGVRQNLPNSLPVTRVPTVHPSQGFGGPAFNNNNPALRVPEATRGEPVSFVGCRQLHPSPSILTEDGNQCLPPWNLPNEPRRYYPNDPYSIPAVTARTQAPPLQKPETGGTGVNVNTNSALKEPKDANLRPASLVESMGSYPRLPLSRTENATRGMPPTSSANALLPSLPSESHLTGTTNDHAKASLLLRGEEGGQFDPSALEVTETARLWPNAIAENKKPHPSTPVARVEEAKHGLTANSLSNDLRSNISNDAMLIQDTGEQEEFDNKWVLGIPEVTRFRTAHIAEDKAPYPSTPLSRTDDASYELPRKMLVNISSSTFRPESGLTTCTESRSKASLRREGGEGGQFDPSGLKVSETARLLSESGAGDNKYHPSLPMLNNNSTLRVPAGVEIRPKPFAQNTKPHPSHLVSTADGTKHGFSLKMSSNAPRSIIIEDPPLKAAISVCAEASLIKGGGEDGQFDNNSTLEIFDTSLEWGAGINPRSSTSMSRGKEAKQWSRMRDYKGKEYFFNANTGESQHKKPDCFKKYTYRR